MVSILTTEDGSHTAYSQQYEAHYHSRYGAVEESMHVFISAGLYHLYRQGKKNISVFEMGMGTALNVFLTYVEGQNLGLNVDFHNIESHPLNASAARDLNYEALFPTAKGILEKIHQGPWNTPYPLSPQFQLHKIDTALEAYTHNCTYDVIYYDAFAPSCQPELWEKDIHQKLYDQLNPQGVLVTYCTQGAFRRMLTSLGYSVERLNGPAKKREMIRATKP